MNSRMLRRAVVATALVGVIAVPSAMACGGGKAPAGPPGGVAYKQPSKSPPADWGGRGSHRGDRGGPRGGADPPPPPPPGPPPVDPPPVDPPTGPEL